MLIGNYKIEFKNINIIYAKDERRRRRSLRRRG